MNLLLITECEKKHYVLIEDFNSLVYHISGKFFSRKYFCMYCLQCYTTEDILNKHKIECIVIDRNQAIKMPDENNKIF